MLFHAAYGLHAPAAALRPFLAACGAAELAAPRAPAARRPGRARAQAHLDRLQLAAGVQTRGAMDAFLAGLGLDWVALSARLLAGESPVGAGTEGEDVRGLLLELVARGLAGPVVLRLGALCEAAPELASGSRRFARVMDALRAPPARAPRVPLAALGCLRRRPKAAGDPVRTRPAAETLSWAEGRRAAAGITRVADVTGLDRLGLPVFTAVRPAAVADVSVACGKGLTAEASLASCLMEALEVATAERPRRSGRRILVASPAAAAARADLVPLERLCRSRLASPLSPDEPLEWVDGVDLLTGETRFVPLELVAMGDCRHRLLHRQTTNGLASGNCLEEAILHALLELVERDAVKNALLALVEAGVPAAVAGYARIRRASLPPAVAAVVQRLEARETEVRLLDLTGDLGVPTVAAVLRDATAAASGAPAVALGFGCHLQPAVAALRAVTEAAQAHTVAIQGVREDLVDAVRVQTWPLATAHGPRQGWDLQAERLLPLFPATAALLFAPEAPERDLGALPGRHHDDVLDDLDAVLDALAGAGLREVVAVDLTVPEIGVPVVRVVAPGLEPLDLDRTGRRGFRHLFHPAARLEPLAPP
jgi:ribosomal protein S12 methylthiotransferase accessory factor